MLCTEPGRQAEEAALTLVRCPQLTDKVTEALGGVGVGAGGGDIPRNAIRFLPLPQGKAPPSLTQGLARADSSGGRGSEVSEPFYFIISCSRHLC